MNAVLLKSLMDGDDIHDISVEVESASITNAITGKATDFPKDYLSRLSVAANLATQAFLEHFNLNEFIQTRNSRATEPDIDLKQFGNAAYENWDKFVELASQQNKNLSADDLLYFAAIALQTNHNVDLRTFLRSNYVLSILGTETSESNWASRVRTDVSRAILCLVRQSTANDIELSSQIIDSLVAAQKELESKWLESKRGSLGAARGVLALYHLARAVVRMSEYLLSGSVEDGDKREKSFKPELLRLLDRAEEYAESALDFELLTYIRASGIALAELQASSLWASVYGTSGLMDRFLECFPTSENPIFSLLPSQQEALRSHLLDPASVAVVLQMPTNTGKTLLAEFSILQALALYGKDSRIVYVTPTRALATQVRRTLADDFRELEIDVSAAGSAFEEDPYELNLLSNARGVVVATPEKLDLLLRSHPDWFTTLRLVVVDEAHLIRDAERGAKLELLLANLRREVPNAKMLLMTPFAENAQVIAQWLGGERGVPIRISWRPSRVMVGVASFSKKKKVKGKKTSKGYYSIKWSQPNSSTAPKIRTKIKSKVDIKTLNNGFKKAVYLGEEFQSLGSSLVMFPASPQMAEDAALHAAEKRPAISLKTASAELRVAIALANAEYGESCALAQCLAHGVAFHHSSISPDLRFLIEDLAKTGEVKFVCATTTLAQGMNFPVASVIVHSIHKPYRGKLSPGEFWNIAGRAGRVGLVDRGLVVFANKGHQPAVDDYLAELSEPLISALTSIVGKVRSDGSLKEAYRLYPQLRALIQYIAHAVVQRGYDNTASELEEVLQASLANRLFIGSRERREFRDIALNYLKQISAKTKGYLRVADTTGLGTFSFDELYARINNDQILIGGPHNIQAAGERGIKSLISALAWLPDLDLAIGKGAGQIDIDAVTRMVDGWIKGKTVKQLAREYPEYATDEKKAVRRAGSYVFGTVSQMVSWGAHAYIKGWLLSSKTEKLLPEDAMLPSYIQYGVSKPEAAIAALLGVPRSLANPVADIYRATHGDLVPENSGLFQKFVYGLDDKNWGDAIERSRLTNKVSSEDIKTVVTKLSGRA